MTEQAKHTPGPWKVVGKSIKSEIGRDQSTIARIDSRGKFLPGYDEANARLIAAAPDLLEALKTCRDALRDHVQYDNGESLERDGFVAATTAIGKAEGEA